MNSLKFGPIIDDPYPEKIEVCDVCEQMKRVLIVNNTFICYECFKERITNDNF